MILQTGYVSLGSFVGIFYEGAVLTVMCILLVYLFRIYKRAKVPMTLNLFLGYACYTIAMFFSWLAKWYLWQHAESALEGPYLLQLIYKFKLSMIFVVIANYFMYFFFGIIYNPNLVPPERSTKLIILKSTEVAIIGLSHIPAFLANDAQLALTTDALGFLIMILDMAIFIPYGIKAYKNSKVKAFGKTYTYIAIMCFFMFNTAVMFLLDRVTMIMEIIGPFGELGYTIFYFLGWSSVMIAMIFAIFGFVLKKSA